MNKRLYTDEERRVRHNEAAKKYRTTSRKLALETGCIRNLRMRGCSITKDEYRIIMSSTHCSICNVEFIQEPHTNRFAPVLDHCHISGKPRKAICRGCNIGIGMFKDSEELLQKAIVYLKEFNNETFNS